MAQKFNNIENFWQELKQRKVVRAMTVYLAAAFAILQAADMILPRIGLPDWTVTLVFILLGAGLIVVMTITWIYDKPREGIKKTSDIIQTLKNGNPEIEFELPQWKSTATQAGGEPVSYMNDLYAERIKQFKKKGRIYNYSSIVVILAVAVLFIFFSSNTVPFDRRDWIVITDFENLTDNPVFDKSLYTAFSLSTSQSRYINVLPRSRMLETLARMELIDQTNINERIGREIAIREGINLYIVPSISEVGNKYAITAKILETKSGNLLRSEILYVESQDEILPSLDKLSTKIRRNLGESRFNIAQQDKSLAKVTTSSLEALKQYSLGNEHLLMRDFAGAKEYYETSLRIDTGFTAAKASLGSINIERYDSERGRELLNQAVKSIDNLTDRERLSILSIHALDVENDIPKSIEYTKRLIELYPDDPVYHNNLGYNYEKSNKYEEAIKEYKTTVKINPNMVLTYANIPWIYLQQIVRIDSALFWSNKLIADNPQNAWGYLYLGLGYISIDSIAKAETAFQRTRTVDPYFILNLYELAHIYRIQERYKEAIRILEKIPEINQNEPTAFYDLGVNYQCIGNLQEAHKYYSNYKKIVTRELTKKWPNYAETYISIAAVTARLGDMDSSKQMLRKAIELDSTLHYRFAEVLCLQGKIPEALDELGKALDSGYRKLFWLKLNPDWQVLQNDARFRNLLEKYFN